MSYWLRLQILLDESVLQEIHSCRSFRKVEHEGLLQEVFCFRRDVGRELWSRARADL